MKKKTYGRRIKKSTYSLAYKKFSRKAKEFVPTPNFLTKASFIKVPRDKIPVIFVNQQALQDMFILVDECNLEVGWLGKVSRRDSEFHIEEIYLLEQKVNSITTELTKNGQEKLFLELIAKPDGLELVNKIRFWGHSHVNMYIGASSQDDDNILDLAEDAEDYFIQGIFNKLGKLSFNILLIPENLKFTEVPWKASGKAFYTKTERRKYWKKEIKDKVVELKVFVGYQGGDLSDGFFESAYSGSNDQDFYKKGELHE